MKLGYSLIVKGDGIDAAMALRAHAAKDIPWSISGLPELHEFIDGRQYTILKVDFDYDTREQEDAVQAALAAWQGEATGQAPYPTGTLLFWQGYNWQNIRDMGEAAGLHSFDTAFPQSFAEDMRAKIGEWPVYIVWSYDGPGPNIWGRAAPVNRLGEEQLAAYHAAGGLG